MVESGDGTGLSRSTKVDLGEDLLETTTFLNRGELEGEAPPDELEGRARLDDQFESARILMNEGLLEEAKKVLRRIILTDPHYVPARKRLEEIHEQELKQLFTGAEVPEPRKPADRRSGRGGPELDPARIDTEAIMRKLDTDLHLGVFGDGSARGGEAHEMERLLFGSTEEMEKFAVKLDGDLTSLSGQDRMDVGIAFLEMGLLELAARQFQVAARDAATELPASALLAHALLLADRPFEATLGLEAVLNNPETEPEQRIHFLYLMARAMEQMGKREPARARYAQVLEIDPHYRDAAERMQRAATRSAPGPVRRP